jgi:hypothetical protein
MEKPKRIEHLQNTLLCGSTMASTPMDTEVDAIVGVDARVVAESEEHTFGN